MQWHSVCEVIVNGVGNNVVVLDRNQWHAL